MQLQRCKLLKLLLHRMACALLLCKGSAMRLVPLLHIVVCTSLSAPAGLAHHPARRALDGLSPSSAHQQRICLRTRSSADDNAPSAAAAPAAAGHGGRPGLTAGSQLLCLHHAASLEQAACTMSKCRQSGVQRGSTLASISCRFMSSLAAIKLMSIHGPRAQIWEPTRQEKVQRSPQACVIHRSAKH